MSATSPCTPCCPTPQTVNVPGTEGNDGHDGINGVDAFTLVTTGFSLPAIGSTVTVDVADSSWMVVGQNVVCEGPANFVVTALPTLLSATLRFLGYPGDEPPTTAILIGDKIGPAGIWGGGSSYYTESATDLTATDVMEVIVLTVTGKTVTLPTAVGRKGRRYTLKINVAGSGTLDGAGAETIDGLLTYVCQGNGSFVTVVSDDSNWKIIVRFGNHYTVTGISLAATAAMDFIEATADGTTITLPTAVGIVGKMYVIFQSAAYSSGTLVDPAGAETINASADKTIAVQYGFITVVSNGANWIMLANKLT